MGAVALTSSFTTLSIIDEAAIAAGFGDVRSHLPFSPGIGPKSRISHDMITRLFMSISKTAADDAVGLHLAMRVPLRAFNVPVYAFLSSPTLGVGVTQWVRFQLIHTLASQLAIRREGRNYVVSFALAEGDIPNTRAQIDYYMALVWRYMLWQTGDEAGAVEVRLRTPARRGNPYEDFYRAPVRFGRDEDAILLSPEMWDTPSIHASAEVFEATTRTAELHLTALQADKIAFRAHIALRDLATQPVAPDLAAVASRLNMSARTVQRRLAEEGTSFKLVMDDFYAETARRMLSETKTSIPEIADRCGFVDRRSFYRAFLRWTGRTPAQYRREARIILPAELAMA